MLVLVIAAGVWGATRKRREVPDLPSRPIIRKVEIVSLEEIRRRYPSAGGDEGEGGDD